MTSKGQVTIPASIRDILKLEPGSTVLFKLTDKGVLLSPCEFIEKAPYSAKEWKKIEKLVAEKGKGYKSARSAKKHISSL